MAEMRGCCILRLHIRPRHMTDEGLASLRSVLEQHPGEDLVEMQLYSQRFRLPIRVDASKHSMRREATRALGGVSCAILIGAEPAF